MKLIHPVAYQLSIAEDRIRALEKENHELRLELSRLTGQEVRKSTAEPTKSSTRHPSGPSEQMLPSYARSTNTSRLRSSPSLASRSTSLSSSPSLSPHTPTRTTQVKVKSNVCSYHDGSLDLMSFRYLKSTVATRRRDEISLAARVYRLEAQSKVRKTTKVEKTKGYNWWDYEDRSHKAISIHYPSNLKPADTLQIMTESDWDEMVAQKAIAIRTRLIDGAWARKSHYKVFINHDTLFAILFTAESLAKRCLWGWMRTYRPEECKFELQSPSDVDFGRSRLEFWLIGLPSGFFSHRYTQSWEVVRKLYELVDLRNFLHHFNGRRRGLWSMDDYVKTVQELAVLLYDEQSAGHARALRDRLREEAKRTLEEIETLLMLTSLPEAGAPWSPHHADLIQDAMGYNDSNTSVFPRIVCAAAREWKSHNKGYYYGVTPLELEAEAEAECLSSHGPGLSTVTSSQRDASSAGSSPAGPVSPKRRWSIAGVEGRTICIVGGQAEVGTRRRATSVCSSM